MTEGWMCIVAKETWERKYQTCHILSLLAAVIVNYICKICSGDTFLDPSIPLFHISIHLCIQNFAMNVLDISFFFFFLQKQSVLVGANECLAIHTHIQTC